MTASRRRLGERPGGWTRIQRSTATLAAVSARSDLAGGTALVGVLLAALFTGPSSGAASPSEARVEPAQVQLELALLHDGVQEALVRRAAAGGSCRPETIDDTAMLVDAWVLTDAWGELYELYWTLDEDGDEDVRLISKGPDGELDTADDILGEPFDLPCDRAEQPRG